MPEEPVAAAEWLMPKVLKDLSDAKLLPLKIGHLKHQSALCNLTIFSQSHLMPQYITLFIDDPKSLRGTQLANHAHELEDSYNILKNYVRQAPCVQNHAKPMFEIPQFMP